MRETYNALAGPVESACRRQLARRSGESPDPTSTVWLDQKEGGGHNDKSTTGDFEDLTADVFALFMDVHSGDRTPLEIMRVLEREEYLPDER